MPYLVVVLTLLLIISALSFNKKINQNSETIQDIQNAQIETCQKSGNPTRKAVEAQLEFQLAQSKQFSIKDYQQLFPTFPPHQLKVAIQKQNELTRRLLPQVAPINCNKIFDNNN